MRRMGLEYLPIHENHKFKICPMECAKGLGPVLGLCKFDPARWVNFVESAMPISKATHREKVSRSFLEC